MDKQPRFYGTDFDMEEILPPRFPDRTFRVEDYGGRGDGASVCTSAIRRAVEACAEAGGGTVFISAGTWLTGPIHLRSGVNLRVEKGATLGFSGVFGDYLPAVFTRWEGVECYNYSPLIYARGCHDVAVTGEGRLVGNGEAWWPWKKLQQAAAESLVRASASGIPPEQRVFGTEAAALRPPFIQMVDCRNVLIEGLSIEDGPMWTIHPVYCQNVIIRGVSISTRGPNTDGVNPDSCRNVLIEDCRFAAGDDCIAINSGMNEDGWRVGKPCENIVVRSCRMTEGHGAVVVGSGMSGGVRNVCVRDCAFSGCERGIRLKSMRGRGGFVEGIAFESIDMSDVRLGAIQISMFYESSTVIPATDRPPEFRNIRISGIRGGGAGPAIEVRGLPEQPLRDVHFTDVSLDTSEGIVFRDVELAELRNVVIRTNPGCSAFFENIGQLRTEGCGF